MALVLMSLLLLVGGLSYLQVEWFFCESGRILSLFYTPFYECMVLFSPGVTDLRTPRIWYADLRTPRIRYAYKILPLLAISEKSYCVLQYGHEVPVTQLSLTPVPCA